MLILNKRFLYEYPVMILFKILQFDLCWFNFAKNFSLYFWSL